MSTKSKTPAKKTISKSKTVPVAKALTVKAPARTQAQEKVVTKVIESLKKPAVIPTAKSLKTTEKKLDTVMKNTQTAMKKEVAKTVPVAKALTVKAPARTQAQEKVVTKAIKELKKPVVVVAKIPKPAIKKPEPAKAKPKTVSRRMSTKDMMESMSNSITKATS